MTDLQLIKQLLNGEHLEPKELQRSKKILNNLNQEIKSRKF